MFSKGTIKCDCMKGIWFLIIVVCWSPLSGQVLVNDFVDPMYLQKDFAHNSKDIEGTPYFSDWSLGKVITTTGKVFESLSLRYDVYSQYLLYDDGQKTIALNSMQINEFVIQVDEKKRAFKSFEGHGYLEILAKGQINLYRNYSKKIKEGEEPNGYNAHKTKDKFVNSSVLYYSTNDGPLKTVPSGKKDRYTIFGEGAEEAMQLGKEKRLNIGKDDRFQELIDIYNALNEK